jgi:hypothetical protein
MQKHSTALLAKTVPTLFLGKNVPNKRDILEILF